MDPLTAKAPESVSPPALGKYAPFARLGHGGMADVFLAVARGPVGFNKLVVIKRLRGHDDASLVTMFLDEARLSARLNHPNIVDTYEVGEAQGQYYIAMEYLEGQTLQAMLTSKSIKGKGLDETVATWVAIQALHGLHYAHELADYDGTPIAVVHRDVTPHNLFLTYRGEVKLLDFGIAKAALNATQTETGVLKGKVRYMAPEQIGEKTIDRRADVYALGVVLWEMLAGRTLFQGDVGSVIKQIETGQPPLVGTVRSGVSPRLEAIVARALQRDLTQRYPTAEAMRLDLEEILRDRPGGTDAALAQLLNGVFAETRDAVRARIKSFLAAAPTQAADMPSASALAQAAELLPPLFTDASGSGSGRGEGSGSGNEDGRSHRKNLFVTPVLSVSSETAAPRGRAGLWLALGGAVAALAVGAVVLRTRVSKAPAASGNPATSVLAPAAPVASTSPVHLESSPAGAVISWNGAEVGRTPADVQLPAGTQTLTLSQDGYEPQSVTLEVKPPAPDARAILLRATPPSAPSASASSSLSASGPGRAPSPRSRPATPSTPTAPTASAARPKIRVVGDDDAP